MGARTAYNTEYMRGWRARNREKVNANQRALYAKNPRRWFGYSLAAKYGLTLEQYDAMVIAQNGKCLTCDGAGPLRVDHDHKTGKVRGLLCDTCNIALGHAQENPTTLRRLADYLERTQ